MRCDPQKQLCIGNEPAFLAPAPGIETFPFVGSQQIPNSFYIGKQEVEGNTTTLIPSTCLSLFGVPQMTSVVPAQVNDHPDFVNMSSEELNAWTTGYQYAQCVKEEAQRKQDEVELKGEVSKLLSQLQTGGVILGANYPLSSSMDLLPRKIAEALAPYRDDEAVHFSIEMQTDEAGILFPLIALKYLKPGLSTVFKIKGSDPLGIRGTAAPESVSTAKGSGASNPKLGYSFFTMAGGIVISLAIDHSLQDIENPKIRNLFTLTSTLGVMELGHTYLPRVFGPINYDVLPMWFLAQNVNAGALHAAGGSIQDVFGLEANPLQAGGLPNTLGAIGGTAGEFYGVYRLANATFLTSRYPALMVALRQAGGIPTLVQEGVVTVAGRSAVTATRVVTGAAEGMAGVVAATELGLGGKILVGGVKVARVASLVLVAGTLGDWSAELYFKLSGMSDDPYFPLIDTSRSLWRRDFTPADIRSGRMQHGWVEEVWDGITDPFDETLNIIFDNADTRAEIQAIQDTLVGQSEDFAHTVNNQLVLLVLDHLKANKGRLNRETLKQEIAKKYESQSEIMKSNYNQIKFTGVMALDAQNLADTISEKGYLLEGTDDLDLYMTNVARYAGLIESQYVGKRLIELKLAKKGDKGKLMAIPLSDDIYLRGKQEAFTSKDGEGYYLKSRAEAWVLLEKVFNEGGQLSSEEMKQLTDKMALALTSRMEPTILE